MAVETLNPDIAALAAVIKTELLLAQVLIRRVNHGFELRHAADRHSEPGNLRLLAGHEVRPLAQFTSCGAFRALKSAPNLASGWRLAASDERDLGAALNQLYPGAVADWFAAQSASPPVTSYRQFTARQTGMYRITTLLDDATAGAMTRACCPHDFCLKRRLWNVGEGKPDDASEKSLIPCLEPCAILLEFARKIARLEQEPPSSPRDDFVEISAATAVAGCEFDAATNPRRLRYFLEKRNLTPDHST